MFFSINSISSAGFAVWADDDVLRPSKTSETHLIPKQSEAEKPTMPVYDRQFLHASNSATIPLSSKIRYLFPAKNAPVYSNKITDARFRTALHILSQISTPNPLNFNIQLKTPIQADVGTGLVL